MTNSNEILFDGEPLESEEAALKFAVRLRDAARAVGAHHKRVRIQVFVFGYDDEAPPEERRSPNEDAGTMTREEWLRSLVGAGLLREGPQVRRCQGPHGWCGELATVVCTAFDGLQWYACNKPEHQGSETTQAKVHIGDWFERLRRTMAAK